MRRVRLCLPAVLVLRILVGDVSVYAQEIGSIETDSIATEVIGQQAGPAEPGKTITASFRVTNLAARAAKLSVETQLPARWTSIFPARQIELEAGGSTNVLQLVRIPEDAAPGSYEITLRIGEAAQGETRASHRVVVASTCTFSIEASAAKRFVEAGKTLHATGAIRNSGNVAISVRLRARSARGYGVAIDTSAIHVSAGEAKEFLASIATPAGAGKMVQRALIITGETPDCGGLVDDAAVLFDVIPGAHAKPNDESDLPGAITIGTTVSGQDVAAQVGFEVGGFVDRDQSRHLAVAVRLPDQRKSSRLGKRGIRRASYESESVTIGLGDTRFGYSTLTTVPGIGRGISIEGRRGPLTAGAFYDRSRFGFPVRSRQGVLLSFQTNVWSSFGATYLRRNGVDRGETVTVYARAAPSELAHVKLEVGDAVAGVNRTGAVAMELVGRRNQWIQYSGRYVHAGPGFPGQYANFDFRHGAITIRPFGGVFFHSSARIERQSFEGTPGADDWRRENSRVRSGLGWRVRSGTNDASIKLDAGGRARTVASDLNFGLHERDVRFSVAMGRRLFSASAHVTTGRFAGTGVDEGHAFREFGLTSEANLGVHTIAASLEYFNGANMDHPVVGSSSSLRIALSSRLNRKTRLHVDGFVSQDDFWGGLYELIHARLSRQIGSVELTARFQYSSAASRTGSGLADLGLSLRVPLSAPNPFRASTPRVHGRVTDATTGKPVEGVLVRLSDSHALSNVEGGFSLRAPGSGVRLFGIDSSTLDVEFVPMLELPMVVDLDKSPLPVIEVPVARAARLVGRFLIVETRGTHDAGPVRTVRPVALAVIEIDDGIGKYRTVTNAAGRFIFPKIRPGKYGASVVMAELPRRYRVARERYEFQVDPGQQSSLEILAESDIRNIRMIAGGEIKTNATDVADRRTRPGVRAPSDTTSTCPADDRPRAFTNRVVKGESLSRLARRHYGDERLWPVIWLANRERVSNPHLISVGSILSIPARRFEFERDRTLGTTHRAVEDETLASVSERYLGLAELWPLLVTNGRYGGLQLLEPDSLIHIPALRVAEISPDSCQQEKGIRGHQRQ
ncbi:MAG: LysM peptidoglycan-binding domain-containing protein [Rhodothermales bacterium]|nr:LysM peptidoglycan-binding domain-containing protein [Rhodothermales bacterium]